MVFEPGAASRSREGALPCLHCGSTLSERVRQHHRSAPDLPGTRTMNESLPDKVFRLGHALATRPKDVSRWLTSWYVAPIRSGLPWLAWGAVDFLDRFLTRSHAVFEYGTGGSTLFFANRAKRVMSVEDDPRWQRMVRDRLAEESLENVTLCLAGCGETACSIAGIRPQTPSDRENRRFSSVENSPEQNVSTVC